MNKVFIFLIFTLLSCHDSGPLSDPGSVPVPDTVPGPGPDPELKLNAIKDWLGGTYIGNVIYRRKYYDLTEMTVKIEMDTFINQIYTPEVMHCGEFGYELNIGELIPYPLNCFSDSVLLGDSIVNYTHYGSFFQELHWHVQEGRIVTYYDEFHPGDYHTISETWWKDYRRQ